MFKNRVQTGRLGGVDGLVGNASNLEFDAQVNRKPVVMFEMNDGITNLIVTCIQKLRFVFFTSETQRAKMRSSSETR